MVYFDVKPLGDLIKEFYEVHKGSEYLDEQKVLNSWKEVVGPFIASHTIYLAIKNKVIFVRLDYYDLRSEMGYSKSLLIKNLNDLVGKEVVDEIVLN